MISPDQIVAAVIGVIFVVLAVLSRRGNHLGTLRVSELPALLWCVLAGEPYRRQLYAITRERAKERPPLIADAFREARQQACLEQEITKTARRSAVQREIREARKAPWARSSALIGISDAHFIVSSVDIPGSGPETMAFPATADGTVTDWCEVAGGHGATVTEVIRELEGLMQDGNYAGAGG